MKTEQLPDLIDRLGRAALECRELIREAHGVTKDLRLAAAEARDVLAALRVAVQEEARTEVHQIVEDTATEVLADFGEQTAAKRDEACDRILRNFDEFAEPLMAAVVEIREEIDRQRHRVELPPLDLKLYVSKGDPRVGKRFAVTDLPSLGNGHGG